MSYVDLIEKFRQKNGEFDHLGDEVFLDHAANGIYMSSLIKDFYEKCTSSENNGKLSTSTFFTNPHSHNQSGSYTKLFIDVTRQKLLRLFNTSQSEYDVVFVQNATYALKVLAESFSFISTVKTGQKSQKAPIFAYLNDNHTSVMGMRDLVAQSSNCKIFCLFETLSDEKFNAVLVEDTKIDHLDSVNNNLFIYPAQSNFNGRKYSLDLIEKIHQNKINFGLNDIESGEWFVCLDTASFICTSEIDLNQNKPDFLIASFYKIFGFPTGLGALLIRKSKKSKNCLINKKYFGGGTISMALVEQNRFCFKNFSHDNKTLLDFNFHEFLEDGTVSYLDIVGLSLAIDKFESLTFGNGFKMIRGHTEFLSEYFLNELFNLKHYNDSKLVEIYRKNEDNLKYGPIFAFNLKSSLGDYIGYLLVDKLAQENGIHLRTGCFCNIGACQMYLPHLKHDADKNFRLHGRKCGDHIDLINGLPTGAIRVSLGYSSIKKDLEIFIKFLSENFVETKPIQNFENTISDKKNQEEFFKIKKIYIYPIKSCLPMKIEHSWPFRSGFGFLFDRNWIIVDSNGIPLTQKRLPQLKNLQPLIDLDSKLLTLSFDGQEFQINLNNLNGNINNLGIDEGDEVAEWLQNCFQLDHKCRLIRVTESDNKSFANKSEFLLINESSVKSIRKFLLNNEETNEEQLKTIDDFLCLQFRPNIVVESLSQGEKCFSEELWSKVKIIHRGIEFEIEDSCTRCQMINIDQRSNVEQEEEKLNPCKENLSKLCSMLLKQIYKIKLNSKFGIYLQISESLDQIAEIDLDDEVSQRFNSKKFKELSLGDVGIASKFRKDVI